MAGKPENVVHIAEFRLAPDNRPSWCEASGIGVFRIRPDAAFDPHFHDFPEYWLFYEGKGKVRVDDETYLVQAGDVVCTPAGAMHDIVEIYEELEGFYLEEPLPDDGRLGHLHRGGPDPATHPIPLMPLPSDFPIASRAGVFGA
jgi:mannose-6-phosphate isomerase-like protein (cupin superfamily)